MSRAYWYHCPVAFGVTPVGSAAFMTCVPLAQKKSTLISLDRGAVDRAKNEFIRALLSTLQLAFEQR